MPVHCCVPLCNQRGVTDSDGNKVSFHRFPRDPATYKKWIIAIKRDEGTHFQVTKSTKVCSKHFKECDYIPGVASAYGLLRDTAVPSVFSFAKEIKVRKPPKQRAQQMTNTAAKRPRQAPSSQGPDSSNEDTALEEAAVCSDSRMEAEQASVVPNSEIVVTGGEVKRLLGIISEQRAELSKLRDECPYLKEQLETARAAIRKLQVENQNLIDELEAEKERTSAFCIDRFKGSDEAVLFYTGLPGYEHFLALMNFLNPGHNGCNVLRTENDSRRSAKGRRRKLSMENELFLVLVRLRHAFVSDLYTGSISDRECVIQSEFLNLNFEGGDSVMADKGFRIEDLLEKKAFFHPVFYTNSPTSSSL
ncbi:peroxynitrite isomerase THAP4-like [Rhipicephalus sanguineus]|uniref:peroxynitrite isomerase THAP4-like n=1 Tax=Rhipicephalus sanguineus TaxID=34632 RepID=UPI00189490C3|nr:peroxynitrite isomerase THAP4-like [Rhipicephalus sanguineus]